MSKASIMALIVSVGRVLAAVIAAVVLVYLDRRLIRLGEATWARIAHFCQFPDPRTGTPLLTRHMARHMHSLGGAERSRWGADSVRAESLF
jgi:hypothetical protein